MEQEKERREFLFKKNFNEKKFKKRRELFDRQERRKRKDKKEEGGKGREGKRKSSEWEGGRGRRQAGRQTRRKEKGGREEPGSGGPRPQRRRRPRPHGSDLEVLRHDHEHELERPLPCGRACSFSSPRCPAGRSASEFKTTLSQPSKRGLKWKARLPLGPAPPRSSRRTWRDTEGCTLASSKVSFPPLPLRSSLSLRETLPPPSFK